MEILAAFFVGMVFGGFLVWFISIPYYRDALEYQEDQSSARRTIKMIALLIYLFFWSVNLFIVFSTLIMSPTMTSKGLIILATLYLTSIIMAGISMNAIIEEIILSTKRREE